MTLMSLVRWIGVLVIVWTAVAIGLGASGTRLPDRSDHGAALSAAPEAPTVEAMPTTWPYPHDFVLVDRTDGRRTPMTVPPGEGWSNVSISPWRGPNGELEAVGRWVNKTRDEFGGWALFRPSGGEVLLRLPAELLANGRPCWVPGRPRTIVFSGGDGQLHRCHLVPEGQEPGGDESPRRVYASGGIEPSDPIEWQTEVPGAREPILLDPVWPSDPSLRRWLLVSLVTLEKQGLTFAYAPARLWWLELSDDARSIIAAGPLTAIGRDAPDRDRLNERFPDVVHGADGSPRLVYEERLPKSRISRLVSAPIEFDPRTGRPRASADRVRSSSLPGREIENAPFLISTDGTTAFAFDRDGQLASFPVPHRP